MAYGQPVSPTNTALKPPTRMRELLTTALGLLILIALILLNTWAFRTFRGEDYLTWYVKNASAVFLGFAFVSLAWGGLDRQLELISLNPLRFLRSYFILGAGLMGTVSAVLGPRRNNANISVPWLDVWLGIFWGFWLFVGFVAWGMVIAPLQFFLHVVTGAPARLTVDSGLKTWFVLTNGNTEIVTGPSTVPTPEGALEAGFFAKPITLTTTLNSVALWGVALLLDRLA